MLVMANGYETFGIISDDGLSDVEQTEWLRLCLHVKQSDLVALKTLLEAEVASDPTALLGLLKALKDALPS